MYQLNAMAFYMLHFLRIKAGVNIFNVNIKLKMPPTKRILDLKDSHQQSMLCYLPSKRLKTKFNSWLSIHGKGLSEILNLFHTILNLNNHYNVAL